MTPQPSIRSRHLHRPLAWAVALALGAPFVAHAAIPTGFPQGGLPISAMAASRTIHPIALAAPLPPPAATALPQGFKLIDGKVHLDSTMGAAPVMTLDQSTKGAVIEWDSFDIGSDATVNFTNATYGSQSVTLNRVIQASDASQIFGQLKSVGTIFLINPAGITFGQGSSISVGGLVASVLDTDETEFMKHVDDGKYTFSLDSFIGTAVTNDGTIKAKSGGTVALIGYEQQHGYDEGGAFNNGSILADGGSIGLLNGKTVTVDFNGDGLTQFEIRDASTIHKLQQRNVGNTGRLQADGGQVVLSSRSVGDDGLGSLVVNDGGVIRARSLSSRSGSIVLDAGDGDVAVQGGTLDASGGGNRGGDITIDGSQVFLQGLYDPCNPSVICTPITAPLDIDASGSAGGAIRVNATTLIALQTDAPSTDAPVQLRADGTTGNGGSILLHATTTVASTAAARTGVLGQGGLLLSATSENARGGTIDIQGGRGMAILAGNLPPAANDDAALLSVRGANGGKIVLNATGTALLDRQGAMDASGTNGDGGEVDLYGGSGLAAWGSIRADGSRNGGSIDTSSNSGFDLRGLRVTANGGSGGVAGVWSIDPFDVTIAHGGDTGALADTGIFYGGVGTSTLNDADISNALNNNTSVTISTGTGGTQLGNVTFDDVDIQRTQGTAAVTFRVDANASIRMANGGGTIASTGNAGPLDIAFNANANRVFDGDPQNGNINLFRMTMLTNGGDVMLYGQSDAVNGYASSSQLGIHFDAGRIDTRVDQNDAGAGGNVIMRGVANDSLLAETGIDIAGSLITTSTGSIDLQGSVLNGDDAGVGLSGMNVGNDFVRTLLSTTSGNITLDGTSLAFNGEGNKSGVRTADADVTTRSGNIAIIGRAEGTPNSTFINRGVWIGDNTRIVNGTGRTLIAGEATSGAAGVEIVNSASINGGSGTVVVQARNNGSGDALAIGGTLASTGTIDLRPGGVDANGNVTETPNDAIAIGGLLGFALTGAELDNITAADLVIGSDIQVGAITVSAPIAYNHNLTLDSGAAGGIAINGALDVGAHTLALISDGNITQRAPITAKSLLVQSGDGAVTLGNTGNNVSSTTLAGSAAGNFTFVNAGTIGIGNVSAIGFGAAANAPTTLTGSGIAGNQVLVRALAGNMILGADVSGSDVDLVSTGFFDNINGSTISATGDWRVWGDTWAGETRGGLAGNGNLPNLYGCTFGATCTSGIDVPTDDDHFIYTQRPTLTVDIGDATREYGLPNGTFNYTVAGLILGDQASNAASGSVGTSATQASDVGSYLVNGTFVSAAGYVVAVNPGALAITPAPLTYVADPYSRLVGTPNGSLGGTVTGFRNDDTLTTSTSGTMTFQSPADIRSPLGTYAINGSGLSARNYTFVQASGNAVALTILPPLGTYTLDIVRDTPVTYVYDRNFGIVGLCPATDLASNSRDKDGDTLAREWSRVRSRPNLANCVSTRQKNSCGDF